MHKASDSQLTMEQARTAKPIGVGPFMLAEWTPDQRVVMNANVNYWQGKPGVDQIIWRTIPEESTRVAELLSGSLDMIYPVTPDFVEQLKAANMKLEVRPGASMRMLQMNVREGSPFADVEVRKAMNMAIDKNAITEHLYNGLAITAEQVAGIGQEGFKEGYDPFPYDPEAAKAILSKIKEPVELITQAAWDLPAQFIAEQLRSLGMTVNTKLLDLAAFNAATEAGDFTLALANGGYGTGEFVGAYYNNHFECSRLATGRVRTGFCSEELDAKYKDLRAELDPVKWQEKLDEITMLLTEVHAPWVPVFIEAEVWAMQPYVNGFTGSSAGQMFELHRVTLNK
jgi:peptide/nickel transport system substrate-binding protein